MNNRIQGVGMCVAIAAECQRVGDYRVWNGGSRTQVTSIVPKGKTQLTITYGDDDVRVLKRTTPVTCSEAATSDFLMVEDRNVPTV